MSSAALALALVVAASPALLPSEVFDDGASQAPAATLAPSPERFVAAAAGAQTLVTAAAITAGILVHSAPFASTGRPEPWVTTGALAVGLGLNIAVTHLAVPWLAAVLGRPTESSATRLGAWRSSRWVLIPSVASVATFALGAGLEHAQFGRGQGLMVAGLLLALASAVAWDVVEAVASWGAAR